MRRGVATGLAVGMVVINAGAFWYLRELYSTPPSAPASSGAERDLSAAPADDRPFVGSILLAGAGSGSVLRTTHGDCADVDAAPAMAWVAGAGAAPVEVEVPGLVETLALGAAGGEWFVIGADAACEVKAWSGSADGSSWSRTSIPEGVWYLDPANDQRVVSPRGSVRAPSGCTPSWVQASGLFAYLLCDDGSAARADRAERRFVAYAASEGLGGLALHEDGRVATLGETPACGAMLQVFDEDELVDDYCFGSDRAGLGVTWAGDSLVAQLGYDLMDENDGDWVERG